MTEGRRNAARSVGLTKADSQAYYERGLVQFAKGNFDEAVVDISEAIYHDTGRAELYAARGYVYVMWAKDTRDTKKIEDALVDLNHALKLSKKLWFAHLALGILDFDDGQWADALAHFEVARNAATHRPEPWFYQAICQYKLDNPDAATEFMNNALRFMEEGDKRKNDANKWLKEFKGGAK